jgi:fructokinase
MHKLLTCIGEILIDFLPLAADGTTTGFSMHPGGGPFNVAVGLARLEQPVAFASKVSSDFFGRYLRSYIEAQGIDARFLRTSDTAPSTLAFVAMEAGEPVFTFYGEGTADSLLRPEELPAVLFAETAILHFGGISLLRGTTPATVLTTVEQLKGQALLSFDPNMRPSLIHDEHGYRHVLQSCFRLADLVKLSATDIAWLAPEQSVEQVAINLLDQGAAVVIVTQGGAGVLALRATTQGEPERWQVRPVQIQVADTVGAGDAFSAGLLTALFRQGVSSRAALLKLPTDAVAEALHFAATVAALTCSRTGANPPHSAEVKQFLKNPSSVVRNL